MPMPCPCLRVVDQPHHVALLLEVEVEHVVSRLALELQQLVVERDDVALVVERLGGQHRALKCSEGYAVRVPWCAANAVTAVQQECLV